MDTTSENALDNFTWDTGSDADFFGDAGNGVIDSPFQPGPEEKEENKEASKGGESEEDKTPKQTEESKENYEFEFQEAEEDSAKQAGGKTKVTPAQGSEGQQEQTWDEQRLSFLRDKGFIDYEDEELSSEDFDEDSFIEDKFDQMVESKIEETISGLPESVKNLIRYATKGGNVDQMIAEMSSSRKSGITVDMNMEDENSQEEVVRFVLKNQGYDDNYIESNIEFLKDRDKLKQTATTHFNKWKAEEEVRETSRIQEQNDRIRKQREDALNYKKDIGDFLSGKPKVNSIGFTRNEIKELPSYMGDATVRLEDGRTITPFYRDLFESLKNKEKSTLLAKIVKSDFNMTDIKKYLESSVAEEAERNIKNKSTAVTTSTGSSQQGTRRNLAEYL